MYRGGNIFTHSRPTYNELRTLGTLKSKWNIIPLPVIVKNTARHKTRLNCFIRHSIRGVNSNDFPAWVEGWTPLNNYRVTRRKILAFGTISASSSTWTSINNVLIFAFFQSRSTFNCPSHTVYGTVHEFECNKAWDRNVYTNRPCNTDGPVAQCPPPQTYRILKFVVGSFRLGTILLIVGSNLDPSYEMWE